MKKNRSSALYGWKAGSSRMSTVIRWSITTFFLTVLAGCSGSNGNSPASGSGSNPTVSAVADSATTGTSTPVSIDVLANDASSNGTRLLSEFDASSANGSIVRDDNGTAEDLSDDQLVYTPNGGFTGSDSFTYTLSNGAGQSAQASVTVMVTDAAFASDDSAVVDQDSADNLIDVLQNDSADLRVTELDTASTQSGATVTIGDNGENVIYTPPAGFSGADQFNYTASRDVNGETQSDTATVMVTVRGEEPPVANSDCRSDIEQRLDAGQGYCFDAALITVNGIRIDLTVFVPHPDDLRANAEATLGAPLPEGEPGFAPLLIHGHGYGGHKYGDFSDPGFFVDAQIAQSAWESGYYVITFTERGFGADQMDGRVPTETNSSSGQIGIMSPRKEGFDFVDLVNWANSHLRENFGLDPRSASNVEFDRDNPDHTNPNVTPDVAWGRSVLMTDDLSRVSSADASTADGDIALATIGYSYGGAFQFNAQSVDPRVDAIMPSGTWHDLRYSLHINDAPKLAWLTILVAFSQNGSNGEPLPPLLVQGPAEFNGANGDPADQPHNKPKQVSMTNLKLLGPNGPVGYCDGNEQVQPDPGFVPEEGEVAPIVPPNAVTTRAPRAHLFMIQGYNDTLFNFNEAYDNARCWESQGADGLDVRLLQQTSGHPLPAVGPAHYAGVPTSFYTDEVLHCGIENGVPKMYVTREVGLAWFDFHLRGILPPDNDGNSVRDADDIFPQVCITQVNTNPNLRLKTGEENPEFNGTNTEGTAFQYSREGAIFESVADLPRGCAGAGADCVSIAMDTADGVDSGFGSNEFIITGPDPSQQNPGQFLPVYTASDSRAMAGIPIVDWQITRSNPSQEEVFFAGIAVKRCHANSADGDGSGTDCEDNAPELLHFQVAPIRVFPTAAADLASMGVTSETSFPKDDPRSASTAGNPSPYPIRWGQNRGPVGSPDLESGRLIGVTARLFPGDVVGPIFYGEHPVFKSLSSPAAGQVSITGTIELPLLDPTPAPTDVPSYVMDDGG